MKDRIIQIRSLSESSRLFEEIGVYKEGFDIMAPKTILRTLYLKDVPFAVCNILKQEMLSIGGETAVSRGIISGSTKKSDCLIIGTLSQIEKLVVKLKRQPAVFSKISLRVEALIKNYQKTNFEFKCGNFRLNLSKRPYIMGILNVTPDSFSDAGEFFDTEKAYQRALCLESEGADIIDIGGQSTRPGAGAVSAKEEIKRVVPVIKKLRGKIKIPISIDTYKFDTAKAALEAGASIINDIYGFTKEKRLAKLAADFNAGVVLMHIKGTPCTMQKNPGYKDLMSDVIESLSRSIDTALLAGVNEESIMIDPGIGFGKTADHNLSIIKNLADLKSLGFPILIGPSRKSFIGKILGLPENERLYGTIAAVCASVSMGANIVRVHDVARVKQALRITDAILRSN
ncbi:MAG: dihydropteroate synthase [Candidatus Omnitrophota bacterium]